MNPDTVTPAELQRVESLIDAAPEDADGSDALLDALSDDDCYLLLRAARRAATLKGKCWIADIGCKYGMYRAALLFLKMERRAVLEFAAAHATGLKT